MSQPTDAEKARAWDALMASTKPTGDEAIMDAWTRLQAGDFAEQPQLALGGDA